MSITLTKNLKLKIDSSFDDVSKYNLNKLDTLASILQVNSNNQAVIRSQSDISFLPNSADIGGSGVGGTVTFGTADDPLSNMTINATTVSFSGSGIGLKDTATGGTKSLQFAYKSDLNGSVDTGADRTLQLDLEGANRNLILGGNFQIAGADFLINLAGLTNGQVLTYNSSTGKWLNEDPTSGSTTETIVTWLPSDGATKVATHGLNSLNIGVEIFNESQQTIEVDRITRSGVNIVTLVSSVAPTGTWTVLIKKYGA